MRKIFVNENVMLNLNKKENGVYNLVMNKNGVETIIIESESFEEVNALMIDVAKIEKEKSKKESFYEPKHNLSNLIKMNDTENTLLNNSKKKEKSIKKFSLIQDRIRDKYLLENMPKELSEEVERQGLVLSDLLILLEESRKRDFEFYEFLKLTLQQKKEEECLNKTKQNSLSEPTISNRKLAKDLNEGGIKTNDEGNIDIETLSTYNVLYISEDPRNESITYLVVENADQTHMCIIKEEFKDGQETKEESFKYTLVMEQKIKSSDNIDELTDIFKDVVDEIINENEDLMKPNLDTIDKLADKAIEEAEEEKSETDYDISSLLSNFNYSDLLENYNEISNKLLDEEKEERQNKKYRSLDDEEYSDGDYEEFMYNAAFKKVLMLFGTPVTLFFDTEPEFINLVQEGFTYVDEVSETVTKGKDSVTIGILNYENEEGENLYRLYLNNGQHENIYESFEKDVVGALYQNLLDSLNDLFN